MTLHNLFPKNSITRDIYDLLYNNPDKSVFIGWIRAHVGYVGNERADELAKLAIDDEATSTIVLDFPLSLIETYCKNEMIKKWHDKWNEADVGRDTFLIFFKMNLDFLCTNLVILYYCTGHGSFPKYLFNINKRSTDKYDCGSRGTVVHDLFGKRSLMPFNFRFVRELSLRHNIRQTLFNPKNYHGLKMNYNRLNELYSIIRYTF